jgi:hypothetical protein
MQPGSLYRGLFTFGDTGTTLTASTISLATIGSPPPSQLSIAPAPSMTGMRSWRSWMPPTASVVSMVQLEKLVLAPALPQPRKGQGNAILAADLERHLRRLRLAWHLNRAPLIEAARGDEAAPLFPCRSEGRLCGDALQPGVDE